MHEWKQAMELDRIPSVRRGEKDGPSGYASELVNEPALFIEAPHMLQYSAGMHDVETTGSKRQLAPVSLPICDPGKLLFEECGIIHTDCRYLLLMRVPGFDIVGGLI
jgi:hypothetical protein